VVITDFTFGPLKQNISDNNFRKNENSKAVTVLREAEVIVCVNGREKNYNLLIKVLPTGDTERYSKNKNFTKMLKFSKEVQVYMDIADPVDK